MIHLHTFTTNLQELRSYFAMLVAVHGMRAIPMLDELCACEQRQRAW